MIKLFVSTFGKPTNWIKNAIPIEVGSAIRDFGERKEKVIYDDVGDNISLDNPYWGELTGLYWIWKNVKFEDDDIIGFCHYNKRLRIKDKKILDFFDKYEDGWIVRTPWKMIAHPFNEEVRALMSILESDYPEYRQAWDRLYDSDGASAYGRGATCSNAQLFFTRHKNFDAYCSFLFEILTKLRNELGNVDRPAFYKRYCASMGERLLSVYIEKNKCECIYIPALYDENYILRLLREVQYVFKIESDSHLVKIAKRVFKVGAKSSYK